MLRRLFSSLSTGSANRPAEPATASICNSEGVVHLQNQDYARAQQSFEQSLAIDPQSAEAHNNLGIALLNQGKQNEAKSAMRQAIQLAPRLLAARENLAALLSERHEYDEAIRAWYELLTLKPDHATACAAKAFLLMRNGRFDEAIALFGRARSLGMDTPELRLQEAAIQAAQNDVSGARKTIASLAGRIADVELDWHLSLIELTAGRFDEGWPRYESRLGRTFESPRRSYTFPDWPGTSLEYGALLILGEQGLGDEVMFASCYEDALRRAGRCVIECDPRLAPLFRRSFPAMEVVGNRRDSVDVSLANRRDIQYQIHAGSLPKFFRREVSTFPEHHGYLSADPSRVAQWRSRLNEPVKRPCIGIAWSGGLPQTRRSLRSVPPLDFAGLLVQDAHFVSLQHDDDGSVAHELAEHAGVKIRTFPDTLRDLDDTAALIRALDCVVTVCSTVVHLAGSLGVPTIVLTPASPEWRYLSSGKSMPWYPSVCLVRQRPRETWCDVVSRVRADLIQRTPQWR